MKNTTPASGDFYQNLTIQSPKMKGGNKQNKYAARNKKKTMKKYLLQRLYLPCFLAFIILLFSLLCINENISEFFAKYLSRGIAFLMSCMGQISSYAVFDILLFSIACVLIIMVIAAIVLYCVKHNDVASFLLIIVLNCLLSFILLFQISTGVIYNRKPIQEGLNIPYAQSESITNTELYAATDYFIQKLNETDAYIIRDNNGKMYNPMSFEFMTSRLDTMLNSMNTNKYLHAFSYRPKKLATSDVASAFNISGITMPLTGEIGINVNAFDYTMPMTLAHELAHSKGVMPENQATALAINVCLNGSNEFSYSAYSTVVRSLLSSIYQLDGRDKYLEFYEKINSSITNEWAMYSEYLKQYDSFLNDVGNFFNNLFLKSNGVKSGIYNYSELDGYIVGIYRSINA